MVYTNVAPKAKCWQVVADNQVVEVPQYLNMDGCKASQEGEIDAIEITPTPKTHTIVYYSVLICMHAIFDYFTFLFDLPLFSFAFIILSVYYFLFL